MILRIFYFFSSFVRKLVILLYHQIDRFHVSSDKSKGIYSISRCFSSFFPSFTVLHVCFLNARLLLLIQTLASHIASVHANETLTNEICTSCNKPLPPMELREEHFLNCKAKAQVFDIS